VVGQDFFKLLRFVAWLALIFTALRKTAAGLWINWRCNLALQDNSFFLVVDVDGWDSRDERLGVRMERMFE
jgi:hypothetical protein